MGDGVWEGVGLSESGGAVSRRVDGDEPVDLGACGGRGLVRIPRGERCVVDGR